VYFKNYVFWYVTPCGSCISSQCASVASYYYVFPSPSIHVTPMMGEIRSSETSVLRGDTRLNIPEDYILRSHRRENLKSYDCVFD
jgi:hypothetical protein